MNKRKPRSGPIYYVKVFLSGVAVVLFGGLTSVLFGWPMDRFFDTVRSLAYLPFMLVILIFFYSKIGRLMNRGSEQQTEETEFLVKTSNAVRTKLEYEKDVFEKLRSSEKFQTFYQDTYHVYQNGESDTLNFDVLAQRFDESEFEYDAALTVIEATKELIEEKKQENTETEENDQA